MCLRADCLRWDQTGAHGSWSHIETFARKVLPIPCNLASDGGGWHGSQAPLTIFARCWLAGGFPESMM